MLPMALCGFPIVIPTSLLATNAYKSNLSDTIAVRRTSICVTVGMVASKIEIIQGETGTRMNIVDKIHLLKGVCTGEAKILIKNRQNIKPDLESVTGSFRNR